MRSHPLALAVYAALAAALLAANSAAADEPAALDDCAAFDEYVRLCAASEEGACLDSCTSDCALECGGACAPDCGCGVAVGGAGGGSCLERSLLFGCDGRAALAASGVTLDADNTNFYFGNTRGGTRRDFEYGAHDDYVLNVDAGKLGLQEGLFVKLRAEHRFGRDINGDTGAFLPSTLLTQLPVADSEDLYLTNVLFTQAFSENFAVFAGKLDTLDADMNAFAHGRGKTQFSNLAFIGTPLALRAVPYSTLGAGFVVLSEMQPIFQFSCLNATDTTRTSGFDELFNDGCVLAAEMRLPTPLIGGMPGHQVFGGAWNSRDFVSLGQDPRIILPDVPIAQQTGSWVLYWNTDQYLVVDSADPLRGWGYFARAGVADEDTNPIEGFLSAGIGGSSPLASRPADTFGFGWYRAYSSDRIGPVLQAALGPIGDGQGLELFYNIAVTPWCHITPDLQYIMPAREVVNDALVAGVRAKVDF